MLINLIKTYIAIFTGQEDILNLTLFILKEVGVLQDAQQKTAELTEVIKR